MSRSEVPARAVERVTRACRAHPDGRSLRLALLDEIRDVVPFDAYVWMLTDPETEVGCAPLAEVPCFPELPRLIRLKYLTPLNRWTGLDGAARSLRAAADGHRDRSLVWRELLSNYDVGDVVSVVLRDEYGVWGFLDLWRIGADATFTDEETAFLTAVAPPITRALRASQASTFDEGTAASERTGPILLVLSPELEVRAQTPQTEEYLRILVPPDGDRQPVPAAAYNVAAQLVAVEHGVDDHPASARVHLAGGRWLTLRAARMGGDAPTVEQDIAVTIELCSPTERVDLFTRAHGCTPREAELVGQLVTGADTRTIAQAMFLSEHTVQDHLKSIFAKTGTRNRRALLARALGS